MKLMWESSKSQDTVVKIVLLFKANSLQVKLDSNSQRGNLVRCTIEGNLNLELKSPV